MSDLDVHNSELHSLRDVTNMMAKRLLLIALVLFHGVAFAQAFKPYPNPKITRAQWQAYFDEVKAKHGASMQMLFADRLLVFADGNTGTSYAFTQPEHPAYPAWVARTTVRDGQRARVIQTGYYAGDQRAFSALFNAFRRNLEKTIEKGAAQQKSEPVPAEPPPPSKP